MMNACATNIHILCIRSFDYRRFVFCMIKIFTIFIKITIIEV